MRYTKDDLIYKLKYVEVSDHLATLTTRYLVNLYRLMSNNRAYAVRLEQALNRDNPRLDDIRRYILRSNLAERLTEAHFE